MFGGLEDVDALRRYSAKGERWRDLFFYLVRIFGVHPDLLVLFKPSKHRIPSVNLQQSTQFPLVILRDSAFRRPVPHDEVVNDAFRRVVAGDGD
jgi:hypothetical protein